MTNWQTKKLSGIGTFSKGSGIPKDSAQSGELPAIRYGELYTSFDTFVRQPRSKIDEETAKSAVQITKGDILFAGSGETVDEIGKSAVYLLDDDGYAGGDIVIMRPNTENSALYLGYLMNSEVARKELRKFGQGQSVVHIYRKDLESLAVSLPEKPEQQRIVSVLEVWDEYIEKLEQKIALKEQLKKGLMQQLLTGKRRLPGFNDKWKTYRVAELGELYSGLTGKTKDDFGVGEPFITYMNIYTNPIVSTRNMRLVKIGDDEKQNAAQYGDIFFTTSSETPNEVGISSVLLEEVKRPAYLNSFCFGFRMHELYTLTPGFAAHYFRGYEFRKKMARIAQGASRYNLSRKYFINTEIDIPRTDEQLAIVEILNRIDKQIYLDLKKCLNIRLQKNYLLKKLITGTIRTPENLKPKGANP